MDWAYRINKKNAHKVSIECEAKKLLEGIEEDWKSIFKIALIKSNGEGGKYIQLVQRAVNELYNIAINPHVPWMLAKFTAGLKDCQCLKTDAGTVQWLWQWVPRL